jgi:hypothetical protein
LLAVHVPPAQHQKHGGQYQGNGDQEWRENSFISLAVSWSRTDHMLPTTARLLPGVLQRLQPEALRPRVRCA